MQYDRRVHTRLGDDDQSTTAICNHLLEETGHAILSADFDKFAQHFLLPQSMETFAGKRLIRTEDDLRDFFDGVVDQFRKLNVTEMSRRILAAEFRGSDRIEATHETRLMSGNIQIQEPYPVFTVLHLIDGAWKISDGQYALTEDHEQISAFTPKQP